MASKRETEIAAKKLWKRKRERGWGRMKRMRNRERDGE